MDSYAALIQRIAEQYDEHILAMLKQMRDGLTALGVNSDPPIRMWDDNFRWTLTTFNDEGKVGDGSMDVMIQISEQRDYDGEDAPAGINFSLDITAWGGVILGGLSPFNYTSSVWVDAHDDNAVRERFALLRGGVEAVSAEDLSEMADKALADQ